MVIVFILLLREIFSRQEEWKTADEADTRVVACGSPLSRIVHLCVCAGSARTEDKLLI
jgi:hypothetical protein